MDDDSFLYCHRLKSQTAVLQETLLPACLAPHTCLIYFLFTGWNASILLRVIFSLLLLAGSEVIVPLDPWTFLPCWRYKNSGKELCRKKASGVELGLPDMG